MSPQFAADNSILLYEGPFLETDGEIVIEKTPQRMIMHAPEGASEESREKALTEWYRGELNDDSLRRMLCLASQRIMKHWHARCQNWDMVLSQLELMFPQRAAS